MYTHNYVHQKDVHTLQLTHHQSGEFTGLEINTQISDQKVKESGHHIVLEEGDGGIEHHIGYRICLRHLQVVKIHHSTNRLAAIIIDHPFALVPDKLIRVGDNAHTHTMVNALS